MKYYYIIQCTGICHLLNVISSNTPTLTHLIIHPPHLNNTRLNTYSVPPGILEIGLELLLTPLWKTRLWFVAALVNKLVPWCAWLLSSALEVLRLRLRLRLLGWSHYCKVTIRPGLAGTVPIFKGVSRENWDLSRDAQLSRFFLAVPDLSRICVWTHCFIKISQTSSISVQRAE